MKKGDFNFSTSRRIRKKPSKNKSQWHDFGKSEKPQKGVGIQSTLKHSNRPDGLGKKGLQIYNLYDTANTYPPSHNQRKKINEEMTQIFWKCETPEQELIDIQFMKMLLVWN